MTKPLALLFTLGSFVLAAAPHAAADSFGDSDIFYVTDGLGDDVTEFNNGTVTTFTGPGLIDPTGVAYYNDKVFVASAGTGDIEEFSRSGKYLGIYATGLVTPEGLAFDSNGNLYVADESQGVIQEIAAGSHHATDLRLHRQPGTFLSAPEGLVVDAQGQIDVTMGGVGTVVARINPLNDTLSFTTVPGLAAPDGIANAPNGDVTVINLGTGTAERVTLDGCTSFQSVPFGSTALGYDAQGNLFVVNSFTDSITEYGTNGQIIGTLHDDLLDPGFIAFDPADSDPNAVPEPSTWGLVLLGLGVIGWRLRRKRAFATAKAR